MKTKVYYYPPANRGGYPNPYSINYKHALEEHFEVLDKDNRPSFALGLSFFLNAFRADIYIINWLESVVFLSMGRLQYVLARWGLWIIRQRKKKMVWMFHNIHPHQGENARSKKIQQILYRRADLIVSHSQEAAAYARQKAHGPVVYICHPVKPLDVCPKADVPSSNVLIWGAISPYKGVKEFLREMQKRKTNLKIHIIGKCGDPSLAASIKALCGEQVLFENRRASFDELAGLIAKTGYVLFPYVGDCVSSSGALIDTIALGGRPVGPDKGAFKDLASEGVCSTYSDYNELFALLQQPVCEDKTDVVDFMRKNSWKTFGDFLASKIYNP